MNHFKKYYLHLLAVTQRPLVAYGVGLFIILFFTTLYILLVLNKYWQFDYFYPDNYFFGHALWEMAQFRAPIVEHQMLGTINIFGDHFHPVIYFFSILLMIFQRQEAILVGMCVLYGASAIFAMMVGFKLLKEKYLTWALLVAYFMYLGTQNAMIYGFHEINFMPFFFFMMLYAFFYKKEKFYWISFAFLLLTKESMAVISLSWGIFIFLAYPKERKRALLTMGLSVFYYILVAKFVIPYFSGGKFLYSNIDKPPTNPVEFINKFIDPPEKIQTFVVSTVSFGLLPILNIAALPLVLQDFFVRYLFAIPGNVQYTLSFHYGVALAPLLFFSSVYTLFKIDQSKKLKKLTPFLFPLLAIGILIINVYFNRFYHMKGPIVSTLIPDFYKGTTNNVFLWNVINKTPTDGSIMTMNHFGYIFSKQKTYLFNKDMCSVRRMEPDYIVFDIRDQQNPNYFFPVGEEEFRKLTKIFLERKHEYDVYYNQGDQYILKKKPGLKLPQCNMYGKYDYNDPVPTP